MTALARLRPTVDPRHLRSWGLLGLAAVALMALPYLTSNDYYLRLLNLGAIGIMLVSSLNLIYGYAGQVSLGHVGFNAIGAYGTALLMTRYELSFWLAWPGAVLVSAGVAWVVGLPVLRLRHFYFAVATFAFGVVVHTVINRWLGFTGGPVGVFGIERPPLPFVDTTTERGFFALAGGSMLVTLVGLRILIGSAFGRTLCAIREGEEPVGALGINTARAKSIAFALSASIAGAAGGLYAILTQYVGPGSYTESHSIRLLAVLVIGGLGRQTGAVVGGAVLVLLTEVARLAGEYQHLAYAGALLAAVLYMPDGVAGLLSRIARAVRERVRPARAPIPPAARPEPVPASAPASASPSAPGRGTTPLLSVDKLTCQYGDFVALQDFDLQVGAGELVALIGPNGAGKSTFINAVSGISGPSSGVVRIDGTEVQGSPPHRIGRAGLVRTFQTTRLFTRLSLEDNLLVAAHAARDVPWSAPERSVEELLGRVGIDEPPDSLAGNLSFGKRRLLELARALAARPRILLLDEPAAGLNGAETFRLGELLQELKEEGLTIVLVEHDLGLVMRVSDRVVVLAFGQTIGEGAPSVIQNDERVIAAYLGSRHLREPQPAQQ